MWGTGPRCYCANETRISYIKFIEVKSFITTSKPPLIHDLHRSSISHNRCPKSQKTSSVEERGPKRDNRMMVFHPFQLEDIPYPLSSSCAPDFSEWDKHAFELYRQGIISIAHQISQRGSVPARRGCHCKKTGTTPSLAKYSSWSLVENDCDSASSPALWNRTMEMVVLNWNRRSPCTRC